MPARSTSATLIPRLTRCTATDVPTIPAPRTIASVRATSDLLPTWSLYMDCGRQERYQSRAYLRPEFSRNETAWCPRGCAHFFWPPRYPCGSGIDLCWSRRPGPRRNLEALSRRSDCGDAYARIPSRRPQRLKFSSQAARSGRRCDGVGYACRARRARCRVPRLRTRPTHAGALLHAGDRAHGARIRAGARDDRPDRNCFLARRPRPRICHRLDCRQPQYWLDARGHGLCNPRRRLALFRAGSISYLFIAAFAEAAGEAASAKRGRLSDCRERGRGLRHELGLQSNELFDQIVVAVARPGRTAVRRCVIRRTIVRRAGVLSRRRCGHTDRSAVGIRNGRRRRSIRIGGSLGGGAADVGRIQQSRQRVLLRAPTLRCVTIFNVMVMMMAAPFGRLARAYIAIAIRIQLAKQGIRTLRIDPDGAERLFKFCLADLAIAVSVEPRE